MRPYYQQTVSVTDKRQGWKLGSRIVPRGLKVELWKLTRYRDINLDDYPEKWEEVDLTDDEDAAFERGTLELPNGWFLNQRLWLALEIESSPTTPPRCVTLRALEGISTPEQRFPLAGIVAEAAARFASKAGSWELGQYDHFSKTHDEYEDDLFEANRARHRRRTRQTVTTERLADIARVAQEHPGTPTAAVQRHFHVSRGYARRLIKQAEAAGVD
jgi:hypothetical protein